MFNRKIISLILAILMLLTSTFTALAFEPAVYDNGAEMFLDSGFETLGGYNHGGTGSFEYPTKDTNPGLVYSGNRAFHTTAATTNIWAYSNRSDGAQSQFEGYFEEGVIYKLSFMAKADNTSANIVVGARSATDPYSTGMWKDIETNKTPSVVTTNEWQRYTLYITPNAGKTVTSGQQYFILQVTNDTVALDEISLIPISLKSDYENVLDIPVNHIVDPTFESKTADSTASFQGDLRDKAFFRDIGAGNAVSGSKVLSLPAAGYGWTEAKVKAVLTGSWNKGAKYHLSFWAKTSVAGETASVTVRSQYYGQGVKFLTASVTDQWQYFEGIATVGEETTTEILNFSISGNTNPVYFDDMNLFEITSMDILDCSIDTNSVVSKKTETISFITATPVKESTLNGITIDKGYINSIELENDYKINLSVKLLGGTTHTISLAGLTDIYGQTPTTASYTFTTDGRTAPALKNLINDPTFEVHTLPVTSGGVSYAIETLGEGAHGGSKVAKFTGTNGNGSYINYYSANPAYYLANGYLEQGKTYNMSFWVKTPSTGSVTFRSYLYNRGDLIVTANATSEWQYFEKTVTVNSSETYNGGIPMIVNGEVYIDDLYILELNEFRVESSTIDENKTNVPLSTTNFTITTTGEIDDEKLNKIWIDNKATVSATLNTNDDYAIDLTLGNLTEGTTYTISNIQDVYGQYTTFTFTTEGEGITLLTNYINDPSFEKMLRPSGQEALGQQCTILATPDAHSGTKVLNVPVYASSNNILFKTVDNVVVSSSWTNVGGKSFLVSFWAKAAVDETFTIETKTEWYSNGAGGVVTPAINNTWQYYEQVITFPANKVEPVGFGFYVPKSRQGALYIDDLNIKEIPAFELASTTLDSIQQAVPKDSATYQFITSVPVGGDSLSTIAINNDATVTAAVSATNRKIIDITINGLVGGTEYTLDLSGVKDIYGQTLNVTTYSFKTSGRTPVTLRNLINDPTFEVHTLPVTSGGVSYAIETLGEGAHGGSKVAKFTGTGGNGSYINYYSTIPTYYLANGYLEQGKTYNMSFWVKTPSTGSVTFRSYLYNRGDLIVTANATSEWQYFESTFTVNSTETYNGGIPMIVNGEVYIDDLYILELNEFRVESSTIDENKTNVPLSTTNFTITTTGEIDVETLNRIWIDNDASVSAVLNAEDEYAIDFTIGNLKEGTTYTISNIQDVYGQFTTFTFTTEGAAVPVLTNYIVDPTFEKITTLGGQGTLGQKVTVENIGANAHSGSKVMYIPVHTGGDPHIMFHSGRNVLNNVGDVTGKKFLVTFYAKAEANETFNLTVSSEWYGGGSRFTANGVNNTWQKFTGVFAPTGSSMTGLSFANVSTARTGGIYIDDLYFYELVGYEITSTSIDANKDAVSPETSNISVTFSTPVDMTTLNTVSISGDASVTAAKGENQYVLDIAVSGLVGGTEYTLDLSGVKDIYGQTLATASYTFTTVGDTSVILTNLMKIGTFENFNVNAMPCVDDLGQNKCYITDTEAAEGSKSFCIPGNQSGQDIRFEGENYGVTWQAGKTYYVSFQAKTTSEAGTAQLKMSTQYYGGDYSFTASNIDNQWRTYSGILVIPADYTGTHARFCLRRLENPGDIFVDDIKVYELPAFTVESTSIDANKTSVPVETTEMTVRTSMFFDAGTLSTITINNGATVSAEEVPYKREFVVNFSGLVGGTEYTLDLSGVKDEYGQALTSITFKTSGRPSYVAPNLMNDPTFELGKLAVSQGGVTFANPAANVGEGVAHSGTYVAEFSGTGGTGSYLQYAASSPGYYALGGGFQEGKTYYVSFWAKTKETGKTGNIKVRSMLSDSGELFVDAAVTDVWQHFEGVATVTSTSNASINGIPFIVNGTVYVDDLYILEIPTFAIESSTIDRAKDKLPLDTTSFTITTTFEINASTLANVAINNGATVSATLNSEDQYAFDVTIGNLTEGEKYTIDLSGVKDIYGQTLTSFNFQVEGYKADDVVELFNLITDPSIESLTDSDLNSQDDVRTPKVVDDPLGKRGKVIEADIVYGKNQDGTSKSNSFMRFEATKATSGLLKKHPWEAGKSYYVSFWARKASGTTKATVASQWYSGEQKFQTVITENWELHSGIFTFADDYNGDYARISFEFSKEGLVYIDDFNIYELVDMEIVETSLLENTSSVPVNTDAIEIVTSLAIDEETINDVAFSSNSVDFEVELIAENVIRIKNITGLTDDALYTINLSSVRDIYGQAMVTPEFTFRTISYIDISPVIFNVPSVVVGNITATTTVTNNSGKSVNSALVLIAYDNDGYIESINVSNLTVGAGTAQEFTATVTAGSSTEYVIAYVLDWDSTSPWQKEVTLGK